MGHVNIEVKARCPKPALVREALKARKAEFKGLDHQVDTYFKVGHGRLKLREGRIENYLIFYDREDKPGPKQSDVILFKTGADPALKQILTKALGILVVVDKQREIYFVDNVKFHIDTVKGLGSFVEIEAIDAQGTIGKKKLLEQCLFYRKLLNISEDELISVSYSDLLLDAEH